MKPSDHQPEPVASDPLMSRLRDLPPVRLDDVTAARTLARAENALAAAAPEAPVARRWSFRFAPPALLAVWAILYVWGAVGALARLFPTAPGATVALTAPAKAPDRAEPTRPARGATSALHARNGGGHEPSRQSVDLRRVHPPLTPAAGGSSPPPRPGRA